LGKGLIQEYCLIDKGDGPSATKYLLNLYKLAIEGYRYNKFLILSILREIPVVDCKAAYTDSALVRRILCSEGATASDGGSFA